VKALLEAHPDLDVNLFKDEEDRNALHAAAFRGRPACVRLLDDAHADLEARDEAGHTALRFALISSNSEGASVNQQECLQVLIENKAAIDTVDYGEGLTPILRATYERERK
jgi:ankyrin repeat protein